jgi:hypothetical protein
MIDDTSEIEFEDIIDDVLYIIVFLAGEEMRFPLSRGKCLFSPFDREITLYYVISREREVISLMRILAVNRRLNLLIKEKDLPSEKKRKMGYASRGYLDLLRWDGGEKKRDSRDLCTIACENGHLNVVSWYIEGETNIESSRLFDSIRTEKDTKEGRSNVTGKSLDVPQRADTWIPSNGSWIDFEEKTTRYARWRPRTVICLSCDPRERGDNRGIRIPPKERRRRETWRCSDG